MLRLHPDKRAKATDLIHHNWMDGILVQGEIDVIRRAEEDEARRKETLAGGGETVEERNKIQAALNQSEADAMKPVDDIAVLSDTEKLAHPPPAVHHPPKLGNAPVSSSSAAKENAAARPTSTSTGPASSPRGARPNSASKASPAKPKASPAKTGKPTSAKRAS